MSTKEDHQTFNPETLFDKFKDYFHEKFAKIENANKQQGNESELRELRNKLESGEIKRPGNVGQFDFCGQLEVALDKMKRALLQKGDIPEEINAIQEAESFVAERKRKIEIADQSTAGWTTIQHMDKGGPQQSSEERKRVRIAEESALKEIDDKKKQRLSMNTN